MKSSVTFPFTINHIAKKNALYVGIDPATSMLGFSILDEAKNILFAQSIKIESGNTHHEDAILDKMILVRQEVIPYIESIILQCSQENTNVVFGIEHFAYVYFKTQMKTIVALASMNYVLQFEIYSSFNKFAKTIYPATARKSMGVIKKPLEKTNIKELVLSRMAVLYPTDFDVFLNKSKTYIQKNGIYDICDSIAIARLLI